MSTTTTQGRSATVNQLWFRAMGSDVHVIVVGGSLALVEEARQRIDALEQRWSRFRRDSEVSIANRRAGEPVAVSADTCLLMLRAIDAWRLTGGTFDPTLLRQLEAAGYDRSFEALDADGASAPPTGARSWIASPGCADLVVGDDHVVVPHGLAFDPGGIGKGLAADLVSAAVIEHGAAGVCVNMGGDVRVRGESPEGDGWTLAIEHPAAPQPIALVGVRDGAVATSSVLRRRWRAAGRAQHHLLDPATGRPSTSDVALATVIAGDAWRAEVQAKSALLRGRSRAFDLLDGEAALVVGHAGDVRCNETFRCFTGGAAIPVALEVGRQEES